MKITEQQILHIAKLAKLKLDAKELSLIRDQLDTILLYFDKLKESPTDGIEPTFSAADFACPLREDRVKRSMPEKESMTNAPEKEIGYFKVPKVIE